MAGADQPPIPPHHDPECFGCGALNAFGLALPLPHPDEEGITAYTAEVRFNEHHQGGPGIVHGGIVSAALDEACGILATWHRFPAVTARIFVRYRRPVPIHTGLTLRARVESSRGRRIRVAAELTEGDEPLAEARAAFLHVPLEHFLATPQGQAAGERWRRWLAERDAGRRLDM